MADARQLVTVPRDGGLGRLVAIVRTPTFSNHFVTLCMMHAPFPAAVG
jgi:hypothetical protein